MINIIILEIFLVLLVCIVWLGPLFLSIKRKTISLIHPSSMFPLFVTINILIVMMEHWIGWSGRGLFSGIRLTTQRQHNVDNFFIIPLVIVCVSGIAYFLGIFVGCKRVVPSLNDRIHITRNFKTVPKQFSTQLIWLCVIFSILSLIPFAIFGGGRGYFWAVALVYVFNFIPVLICNQKMSVGLIYLVLGLIVVGLRHSKGDFIYYILPLVIFNQGSLLIKKHRINIYRGLIIGIVSVAVVFGTIRIHKIRGEWFEGASLAKKIIVREYGFEVFSILVNESRSLGNLFNGSFSKSWVLEEEKEALPSFLGVRKIRPGNEVAKQFLPLDYAKLPDAGFSKFFLFPFYYDFGWIGAFVGSFFLGFVFSFLYNFALKKTIQYNILLPLIIYLPVPVFAEMIAGGSFAYAQVHIIMNSLMIFAIGILSIVYLDLSRKYSPIQDVQG